MPTPKRRRKLNPRQELFCKLYATDREFFGNGVQSYIEAYNPDRSKPNWYKSAKSVVSIMLTNESLCARINELLESEGLNNQFVDKQTLFLITQHLDFNAKIRAIQEYNKLKSRITDKIELTEKYIILDNKWKKLKSQEKT